MSNADLIREYRCALDAAEGVRLAEGLREVFSEHLSEGDFLFACSQGLDEIRERAGTDARVHERRAKRLLEKLVTSNVGLVAKVVKRTLGVRASVPANLEEAMQEGTMGLVRAIEVFDEKRGGFSTCAGFWIRYYAQNCMHRQVDFAKQRPACMPASVAKRVNRFRLEHGREPTPEDLGIAPAVWAKWVDSVHVYSVEDMAIAGETTGDELVADESQSPENEIAGMHLHARLVKAMAEMSPRNRDLTQALFIDGLTVHEAGAKHGLSFQRVAQLKTVLEKRLREVLFA